MNNKNSCTLRNLNDNPLFNRRKLSKASSFDWDYIEKVNFSKKKYTWMYLFVYYYNKFIFHKNLSVFIYIYKDIIYTPFNAKTYMLIFLLTAFIW